MLRIVAADASKAKVGERRCAMGWMQIRMSLYRGAADRLNYWTADRPDTRYSVRVCSKSVSGPRVNNWQRLERVARSKICAGAVQILESRSRGKQHQADSSWKTTAMGQET